MTLADTIASWFGVFSHLWSGAEFGPGAWVLWPLNAMACGVVTLEGFAMLHFSHKRWNRLAYGLVSLGAFAYFVGEISGEYTIVAPVETFFHWAVVVGLGSTLWRRLRPREKGAERGFSSDY